MGANSKKPSKTSAKKQAAQTAKAEAKKRELKRIKDRIRGKRYVDLNSIDKGVLLFEEGVASKLIEGVLGLTRRQILRTIEVKKLGQTPGLRGRPPMLNAQQQDDLKDAIKQGFSSQDSWTIQRINETVSCQPPAVCMAPSIFVP